MPSEHELASRFQVSRPTIRRALDELLRANMVAKKPGRGTVVLGADEKTGPNPVRTLAVNMATSRGPLGDAIRLQIMNGILSAFYEHGIRLALMPEEDILDGQIEDVDGVIWIKDGSGNYAFARALAATHLPVVIANRLLDHTDWNCVSSDHRQGMFTGVEYLIGLGHRRIALIGGTEDAWLQRTRYQGYLDAFRAYGVPVDPDLVLADPHNSSSFEHVRAFLAERSISAVVAFGSSQAPTVLRAVRALFRVPDQVSVVCFDDISDWTADGTSLTSVRQPLVEMGRAAVDLLLDYTRGARHQQRILPCELVVRQSCRQSNSRPHEVDPRPEGQNEPSTPLRIDVEKAADVLVEK